MFNTFPLELIFEVLSHLSAGQILDADTLRASSLISSPVRAFCQRKLFARILVDSGADSGRGEKGSCDRLVEIFAESPHLVSYVRSLVVRDDFEWVRRDKALEPVLRTLSMAPITSFTCIFDAWAYWENNPAETRTAILGFCGLPSLIHIHVSGMPLGALPLGKTSLKCLWIESGNEADGDHAPQSLSTILVTPEVEDLLIADQATLDFVMRSNRDLSVTNLKSLTIRTSIFRDSRPTLQPILSVCKSSLTQLHLGSQCIRSGWLSYRDRRPHEPQGAHCQR
ncbi:hypothetical protein BKA70DRAFT_199062 [Coprinopsis sp. MPI-PUGE-AT-0042]|nr:hypothetical protein BKA70DRAFT_199062 [Coprinopsis sp. MPI-PUGE-AT-0042]